MNQDDIIRMIDKLAKEIATQNETWRASTAVPQSKYKFSRNWYVAEFSWEERDGVHDWCTEQFGPRPKVADAWTRWYDNYHDRIFFRDKEDYIMFKLRWGE